jgi:hypothetical protein
VLAFNPTQRGLVALDTNRSWDIYISADEARNFADALTNIQAHVPENEIIFIGNSQHEQIYVNNVTFYFLAERSSTTKYYDLEPGVVTTAEIQNQTSTNHRARYKAYRSLQRVIYGFD